MKSLFGEDIPDVPTRPKKTGHAAPPGSGPEGKTCGDCAHLRNTGHGVGRYKKCALMRPWWTHGPGTDIRCKDAACRHYEEKIE